MVFKLAEYFVGQFNCMHPQDMGDRSCSECLFDRQIPRVAKTYYYLQRSTPAANVRHLSTPDRTVEILSHCGPAVILRDELPGSTA